MIHVISFIDWYLPGFRAGGVLKAFANQVAHLEKDFYFHIITRNVDYQHHEPYDSVKSDAWNQVAPNAEVYYLSAANINYSTLKKLVKSTNFDVAYIHGVYSPWFSILPVHLVRWEGSKRIVLSAHGMLGRHALAVKTGKKRLFLKLFRMLGYYRGVIFHAANHAEADDIRAIMGAKVKVMVAEELPMKVELEAWHERPKKTNELHICAIARIAPEKNISYAVECLTKLKHGKVEFDIYGPVYEESYWEECKRLIAQCTEGVVVNYKGSIDGSKVLERLRQYHAMFLPTKGENFGHTILESFMAATPVIISNNTPWKRLSEQKAGWDIDLDQQNKFIEALEQLIGMDQEEYNQWSKGAQNRAKLFLSDKTILQQNIQLLRP